MHTPVLRYHGGKYRLAKWICSFFPEHRTYVEPYSGAASVLLRKPRSYGEVYNDLDQELFNLFLVLRDEEQSKRLYELCQLTPYSRDEFKLAYEPASDPIERARRMIVRSSMGFGSGAASGHKTGFRCDAKRPSGTPSHVWKKYPAVIKWVCARLRGVNIENRPALDCITYHDSESSLFYVDPPYLHNTRVLNSSGSVYKHEMSEEDHIALLKTLMQCKGMVILSGYDSDLYNDTLKGWRKEEKSARISASKGTALKTECLWINPYCDEMLNQKGGTSIRHTSQGAYVTHHMRSEDTENKIRQQIERMLSNGDKITKTSIAKNIGISREQITRRYSHLFEELTSA
ncbi:DNA adenine methylase [Vibrio parahaemolyticus]|nr:DNA adenine methylase [Vibrio parahaemolyticus]